MELTDFTKNKGAELLLEGEPAAAEDWCLYTLQENPDDVAAELVLVQAFHDQLKTGQGLAVAESLMDRKVRHASLEVNYGKLLYQDRDIGKAYDALVRQPNAIAQMPFITYHLDYLLREPLEWNDYPTPDFPQPLLGDWMQQHQEIAAEVSEIVSNSNRRYVNWMLWGPPGRRAADILQEIALNSMRLFIEVPAIRLLEYKVLLDGLLTYLKPYQSKELVVLISGVERLNTAQRQELLHWQEQRTIATNPLNNIALLAFFSSTPWWVPELVDTTQQHGAILPVLHPEPKLRLDVWRWCMVKQPNWSIRYQPLVNASVGLTAEDIEHAILTEGERVKLESLQQQSPVPITQQAIELALQNVVYLGKEWLHMAERHQRFNKTVRYLKHLTVS